MTKRDLIAQELSTATDADLDALLGFLRTLKARDNESSTALLAESALAKDWLTPEEEAAWADL